ncbi:MAG: TldD/PmbA family protein [Syntrophomonadaceae bacterium]|nr:TldD/PmbA family protein [Syntrophomonadaceae bacterium]
MQSQLSQRAVEVVHRAQQLGAAMSEVFFINSKVLTIEVREQTVENLKLAEERGLGLRVFRDGRMGFAYSADLSPEAVEEVIQAALANSRQTTVDEGNCLPSPVASYPELDLYDPRIRQAEVESKIELAKEVERVGREYDPRIKITESAGYEDSEYQITIANSLGLNASYCGAYCGLYLVVVGQEQDDNQTGFAVQYRLRYDELEPNKVGREAAEKAVRMLGARKIGTCRVPVVLDPYVATSFLGVLAPALTAEAVQKGKSLFASRLGQSVGSEAITIIDDGTLANGIASSPFDGEGFPSSRTVLIDRGNLQTFLYNTYTAARDGVVSTGNGVRGSFKTTPEVGTTNFFIQPGSISPEKLISDISEGLYITEVMGMHTANPISGDFSVGAAGLWIKNGELTTPVRGVAIAGNLAELLQAVEGVADNLTFFGGKGSPTIRIGRMTGSGA